MADWLREPVLIAGAGIAGLALAQECRSRGIAFHVFERAPELREVGSAILLGMNAYRVLRELKVAELVEQHASEVETAELRDSRGGLLVSIPLGRLSREWGLKTLVCRRSTVQSALVAKLPVSSLSLNWEIERIRETPKGAELRNTRGETAESSLVAACDGIHGQCRQMVFSRTTPIYSGSVCWRGLVDCSDTAFVPTHTMVERLGPGMRFGVAWHEPGKLGWYLTRFGPSGGHDNREGLPERLANYVMTWQPQVGELIRSTPAEAIVRTDLCDLRTPRRMHRGNIVLLGDAAHAMLPNLGQGGASALEDAANLARQLECSSSREAALHEYSRERWRRVVLKQWLSRGYGFWHQRPSKWQCAIRDFIMRRLPMGLTAYTYRRFVAGKDRSFQE